MGRWRKVNERIGKSDLALICLLLLLGAAGFLFLRIQTGAVGETVRITLDGDLYGTYDLSEDASIQIQEDGHVANTLVISNGKAHMEEADCPDKLCIRQGAISRQGQTIVCLPNKIVVEVEGEHAEFDSISQ